MYTLRCTRPLLAKLGPLTPPGEGPEPEPTTILGNWYANRLNVGKHRLVLCTSERTLLSVVVPAKDLPNLPRRLVESLAVLLRSLGISAPAIAKEVREMGWVRFDRTLSRSVLGSMNDMAFQADGYFRQPGDVLYLDDLDRFLSRNICSALSYKRPADATVVLFAGQPHQRL